MAWWGRGVVLGAVLVVALAQNLPEYGGEVHLPRCCPVGQALGSDHTCVDDPRGEFRPQVVVDGSAMVTLTNVVAGEPTSITCGASGVMAQVDLIPGEAVLYLQGVVHLLWQPPGKQTPTVAGDFCVAVLAEESPTGPRYVGRFCYHDVSKCDSTHCVRKCCATGEQLVDNLCSPRDSPVAWRPVFTPPEVHPNLSVAYGFPQCETILVYEDFILEPTGDLLLPGSAVTLPHHQYCVDHSLKNSSDGMVEGDIALACFVGSPGHPCAWKPYVLDVVLMAVSCVFLLASAFIYMSVPELRASLDGRCFISFFTAMIAAFVSIISLRLNSGSFSPAHCYFSASVTLVCVLAVFFWLNVLCFRLWLENSDISIAPAMDTTKWFVVLSAYAWGVPMLVALIGLALDGTESTSLRPHFEPPECWFYDTVSRWAYQYGIILALMLVNLALMLVTFLSKGKASCSSRHGFMLWVYGILGLVWVLEIVSFHIGDHCHAGVVVLDVINALQGVYIFIAAVHVRKDLKRASGLRWTHLATDYNLANGSQPPDHLTLEPCT